MLGLTSAEAAERLRDTGPNAIPEPRRRPVAAFLRKLSGPVPWMLEAALVLELSMGKRLEAAILVVLVLLNAGVSFSHERRAERALELLRQKLRVLARVLRDGAWNRVPAETLVPGDVVHVRVGDFVPADVRLSDGEVLLDRSMLTGESLPVVARASDVAATGSIVRRGEATGEVVATGARTAFGKTVSLLQHAHGTSRLEGFVLRLVGVFVGLDAILASVVLVVALVEGGDLAVVAPFVLLLLLASVPVALPSMFTLSTAVGAAELAHAGVLVTRLAALEEVAALDVLCSDKTGTLTKNELGVAAVVTVSGSSERDVLRFAATASDPATEDPIDLAILDREKERGGERVELVPFDPSTKRAEARFRRDGAEWRAIKGAPAAVASLVVNAPDLSPAISSLAARGCRVLAVAAGPTDALRLVGLIGLSDPPRESSREVVARLKELGVRVLMVTGDSAATAAAVSVEVGIGSRVATRIQPDLSSFDALAGILPEDKLHLVHALQSTGHVVGMTGDGVNDAPALQQSDVGIAVASAVDVAKSSASVVLTEPGLRGVLTAIEVGRRIFERMLTYTLNMSVKKLEIPMFLAIGFLAFDAYVVTPRLLLLLMVTNDLSTMSLASDRVTPSATPRRWSGRAIVSSAFGISLAWLVFLAAVFEIGQRVLRLPAGATQTLAFLALVLVGQANVFLVRERGHLWRSIPGRWTLGSSLVTIAVVSFVVVSGVVADPLPPSIVVVLLGCVVLFTLVLDLAKVSLTRAPASCSTCSGGRRRVQRSSGRAGSRSSRPTRARARRRRRGGCSRRRSTS